MDSDGLIELVQALDLEEEEWEQFANGIAHLAAQRERRPKDFQIFKVSNKTLTAQWVQSDHALTRM